MKKLHCLAFALLIVGGINWGLVGAIDINLVSLLFGESSALAQVVYILVGAAGLFELVVHKKNCVWCRGPGDSEERDGDEE